MDHQCCSCSASVAGCVTATLAVHGPQVFIAAVIVGIVGPAAIADRLDKDRNRIVRAIERTRQVAPLTPDGQPERAAHTPSCLGTASTSHVPSCGAPTGTDRSCAMSAAPSLHLLDDQADRLWLLVRRVLCRISSRLIGRLVFRRDHFLQPGSRSDQCAPGT